MAELLQQFEELWRGAQQPQTLWQVALIAAALVLAWLPTRLFERRLARTPPGARPRLGQQAVQALIFPIAALALLLVGRTALPTWPDTPVVNVAVALLTSLAILRFALVLVRQVFPPSAALQTVTRIIVWTVWIGFALYVAGFASEVLEALEAAHFAIGRHRISVLLVLQATLSVVTAILLALWLGRYVETHLMAAEGVQLSLRVMLTKLAKALFVLLAVLIALPAVGIDLTALSVFGGMLGVGIGFGLQKIAANYVSGFIILMDRSVSLGDVVSIDEHTGRITKLTARYVVVRNPAGTEALIPNETLIGSTVINHTYSDRRVHVPVPVQVAYGTDMARAVHVLEDIGRSHQRVLAEPVPRVIVKNLAESGIDLELGVWIDDPEDGIANVRSDLYFDILDRFAAERIEIPYPQRELRMRPTQPAAAEENVAGATT